MKEESVGRHKKTSMIFNILAKREGDLWGAHCLELDLVATANELETVKNDMLALIKLWGQVRC
ncbi:MAG: hypothetical protein JJE15_11740 [Desulfobacteraceae bacterium]|nr:hypothetical protein [Desulfobacteraceae bacterium]